MRPDVAAALSNQSSAAIIEAIEDCRTERRPVGWLFDAAGQLVAVSHASMLAELAMREQAEQLPF